MNFISDENQARLAKRAENIKNNTEKSSPFTTELSASGDTQSSEDLDLIPVPAATEESSKICTSAGHTND